MQLNRQAWREALKCNFSCLLAAAAEGSPAVELAAVAFKWKSR